MDVKLPNLGEGADSGTVVGVLVKPGAQVKQGQNIIELETGKAVAPIPAPTAGTVSRIAVKEGDKLSVGQLILVLESAEGAPSEETKPATPQEGAPKAAAKAAPAKAPARQARAATASEPASENGGAEEAAEEQAEEVVNENPASGPYVRRVARDLGIDLHLVRGSGKSGQVLPGDLKEYVAAIRTRALKPRAASPPPPRTAAPEPPAPVSIDFAQWGPVTRKPMSQLRRMIAQRMVESTRSLPTVTQFDEADVTTLNELRKKHAASFEARGARLTLTSFILKAVATVLRKHPIFNASLDEAASEIVFKDYVHLGLAVDTEGGLLVPVIRDADRKDLVQLSKEVQDLATKARERKLSLAEMQGGTFTISNQGGIGGAHFTPIVNPPEVAILGLGRGVLKPVVREGQITPRLMMPVAITYDHRVIDGGAAARFTVDLVAAIEGFKEEDIKLS